MTVRAAVSLCVTVCHCVHVPGFACPEATGTLSYTVHGCRVPTAFCPAGSRAGTPTPPGSHALINALELFASASVCEAGRCVTQRMVAWGVFSRVAAVPLRL